uniref:Uncharacterized protein n=1 Tax=Manihot esculenta TaxID=3983 RepID=A0A2C9WK03_MANES
MQCACYLSISHQVSGNFVAQEFSLHLHDDSLAVPSVKAQIIRIHVRYYTMHLLQ